MVILTDSGECGYKLNWISDKIMLVIKRKTYYFARLKINVIFAMGNSMAQMGLGMMEIIIEMVCLNSMSSDLLIDI